MALVNIGSKTIECTVNGINGDNMELLFYNDGTVTICNEEGKNEACISVSVEELLFVLNSIK